MGDGGLLLQAGREQGPEEQAPDGPPPAWRPSEPGAGLAELAEDERREEAKARRARVNLVGMESSPGGS